MTNENFDLAEVLALRDRLDAIVRQREYDPRLVRAACDELKLLHTKNENVHQLTDR
jgi:hypothetical protein